MRVRQDNSDGVETSNRHIKRSTAQYVSSITDQSGRNRRHHLIACNCEVDLINGDSEYLGKLMNGWVVNEACQSRKPSTMRDYGDDAPFLRFGGNGMPFDSRSFLINSPFFRDHLLVVKLVVLFLLHQSMSGGEAFLYA